MRNTNTALTAIHSLGHRLEIFSEKDYEALYQIYQELVLQGTNYPQDIGSREEFDECFFSKKNQVYVYKIDKKIIGGFYLKPNFPGRGKHICNAAYMIHKDHRGIGLGKLLVNGSLYLAKENGYHAMMFNSVLSQNLPAVALYKKLHFEIIGTTPRAIKNPDGSYQDSYIMYRALI